ncbi:RNA-guided endonuclease TnpB family protein [Brevibacillus porteri]|uniref:RNA-guided endonuclease TnpB family protein n=1 Tax=Brevibacillus porteri TaxID=2126350 RepID=UPI0036279123
MSKCRKGSKQYWKYRKAMKKLSVKFDRKINDCVHKITKCYLDYCIENQISIVYYGDLDGATRGTKQKSKGNSYIRQKLGQWNYGQIMIHLTNKLSRYGIRLVKVKEYYTSTKCPICRSLNKPTKRSYECVCGYKQHRDIVGAINILNDNHGANLSRFTRVSTNYLTV